MECRIQFHNKSLQSFDWCQLEDNSGKVIKYGVSTVDEMSKICAESARTLVFLAQQNILLASPQLPPKANKQQLNAIAYNIEELLAEDIEDCFFAVLTQQADHTVPVAVINEEVMDNLVALLSSHHINARFILPQIYLCPWSDQEDLLATVCSLEDGYLIRTGQHEGLFCQQAVLKQVLSVLENNKSSAQHKVEFYTEDLPADFASDSLLYEQNKTINLLSQVVDPQSCINLKQKRYQSSHQWMGLLKNWKWPMAAMVLLAVIFIAGNLLDGWQKQKIYADIINQQQAVLSQHLPELEVTNQPKTQLVKILADNRGSGGQVGFLDLLHEYSRLKAGFKAVKTERIVYQQSRLVVNLETKDLKALETFRTQLDKSSFNADIENVNINPDKTTGRLVMQDTQ